MSDAFAIDFPESQTLGYLVADWIEAHCSVPDGFDKGRSGTHLADSFTR